MKQLIMVSKELNGDFTTVQDAINAIPKDHEEQVTIQIKEGHYHEVITVGKIHQNIRFVGDGINKTVITYNNNAGKITENGTKLGTNQSATAFIDGSELIFSGITFENSFYQPGLDAMGRQAVAVNTTGNNICFQSCSFLGYQDTLYAREGVCRFEQCYIEGDIDFIFGAAKADFYDCEIHSIYGGSETDNGYVTAASTLKAQEEGFTFVNCNLTADPSMPPHTVYLGRPWHPSACKEEVCSKTVFANCRLGKHIKEEGWTVMGQVHPKTERYYEYRNTGEGAFINSSRRQLEIFLNKQ